MVIDPKNVYISFDVETTGISPGLCNMIQLGAVAWCPEEKTENTFIVNIKPKTVLRWNRDTKKFWDEQIANGIEFPTGGEFEADARRKFQQWLWEVRGVESRTPVFLAYPATFDWQFLQYFLTPTVFDEWLWKYLCGDARGRTHCIDIRTVLAERLRKPYEKISRSDIPAAWTEGTAIDHNGLNDAICQLRVFQNLIDKGEGLE